MRPAGVVDSGRLPTSNVDMYGYRQDKQTRVRMVHEPEAAVVRRIFAHVAEGRSLNSLWTQLNREGIPAPSTGKFAYGEGSGKTHRWGSSGIHRILHTPEYKGESFAWKYQTLPDKRVVLRDRSEWVRLPDHVTPAIVEPELWDAVQERLRKNASEYTRNQKRPHLLRGLMRCGECGGRMYPTAGKKGHVTYRCNARAKGRNDCRGKTVAVERVERWVWERVEGVLLNPALIADEVARRRESGPDPNLLADRDTTRRLADKLGLQQERLIRRVSETDDDGVWPLMQREIGRLGEEREAALARIAELDRRIAEQKVAVVQLEAVESYCCRVKANLADLSFERRRDAVEALIDRVVGNGPHPGGWRIEAAIPIGVPSNIGCRSGR